MRRLSGVAALAWFAALFVVVGALRPQARVVEPDPIAHVAGASASVGSSARDVEELARVQAIVDARNAQLRHEEQTFQRAGWTIVDTPAPDLALIGLDVDHLQGREAELRAQITSNSYGVADVGKLAHVAAAATDPSTRLVAVEALGRTRVVEAQLALIKLLHEARLPLAEASRSRAIDGLVLEIAGTSLAVELRALSADAALTAAEQARVQQIFRTQFIAGDPT